MREVINFILSNLGYIALGYVSLLVFKESIGTIIDFEKKKFIYGSENHSRRHISYLVATSFALILYFSSEITGIQTQYQPLIWAVALYIIVKHAKDERNNIN